MLSAYVTSINRVNQVYEYDCAIRMNLIANTDQLIFLDGSTDPYTNSNGSAMLSQNQTTCDNIIGNGNYDIGHVYSTGGGGVASLGSVCNNNAKARGVTGQASPIGDPFNIDYVAHEMGHQFGANHTQNNSCNRAGNTAMEPGSASTIMGYAGICSPNVQQNSDDYFHSISLQEINNEVRSTGHTCEIDTMGPYFNNNPPIVIEQPDYIIPHSTSFFLELNASDPDGDPLEYLWDQMDNEVAVMPPQPTNSSGPTFRSVKYSSSPFRYFPSIDDIVNNTTSTWEVLPSVGRNMSFRGTAKDYRLIGGCNDEEDVNITVEGNSGPFLITTNFSSTDTLFEGDSLTLNWNVASTDLAPVNANLVDILLSKDGGYTYPLIVKNGVQNSGSHTLGVTADMVTDKARFMVRGYQNIFFDITNQDVPILILDPRIELSIGNQDTVEICNQLPSYNIDLDVNGYGIDGKAKLTLLSNNSGATIQIPSDSVELNTTVDILITNFQSQLGAFLISFEAASPSDIDTLDFYMKFDSVANEFKALFPIDGNPNIPADLTFNWSDNSTNGPWNLKVSTDYLFNNNLIDTTISALTFDAILDPLTLYYWKVEGLGSCSPGESAIFSFITEECHTLSAEGLPVIIPSSGTPTINTSLQIQYQGVISDLNVSALDISHTYVDDLIINLINPGNQQSTLMNRPCGSENDILTGFDDEASGSNYPCPPTDGLFYQPVTPLSIFDGTSSQGTWTLNVQDVFNQDGGSINNYNLDICYSPPCTTDVMHSNQSGYGSFTYALNCAATGDTITFLPALIEDTIIVNNPISLNKVLTFKGQANNIHLGCDCSSLFDNNKGVKLSIENLNLFNEDPDGNIINNGKSELNIKDVNMMLKGGGTGNFIKNVSGTVNTSGQVISRLKD